MKGPSAMVKFGGDLNDPFNVVRGSLLGPYLFNLFENDRGKVIEIKFLSLAGDIKLLGG